MNCDFLHTRFRGLETQSLSQIHSTKTQQGLLVCFVSEAHTWVHKITFQNNINVIFFSFCRGSTINHPNCNFVCVVCIHHLHEAENRFAYSKLREIVSHCRKLQECNCRVALQGSIWLQSLPCVFLTQVPAQQWGTEEDLLPSVMNSPSLLLFARTRSVSGSSLFIQRVNFVERPCVS